MQVEAGNNDPGLRVRSMDGTLFWITGDSVMDYVLHPAFLRFLGLAILLFALLDQRPYLEGLGGWVLALLWAAIAAVFLGWIAVWSPVVAALVRRHLVGQLYTPLLLVPMILLVELVLQTFALLFTGAEWQPLTISLQYAARDIIVVGILDLLHSNYVIHAHPLARPAQGTAAPLALHPAQPEPARSDPPPEAPTDTPAPAPLQEGAMVRIGPAVLPMASILLIRTEDHYLGVTTRSGTALHRAKMADIPELHSGIDGMQINRSVWISFAAIESVTDTPARQVVVSLVNGDEERVSKPRIFAFRQAYAKFLAARAA